MAWVYYENNIKNIEISHFSLDFLSKDDLAVLWIKSQSFSFDEQETTLLLKAFSVFYCVLWRFSSMNFDSSLKLNDKKRAFGGYKKLSKNVFLTKEYLIDRKNNILF